MTERLRGNIPDETRRRFEQLKVNLNQHLTPFLDATNPNSANNCQMKANNLVEKTMKLYMSDVHRRGSYVVNVARLLYLMWRKKPSQKLMEKVSQEVEMFVTDLVESGIVRHDKEREVRHVCRRAFFLPGQTSRS